MTLSLEQKRALALARARKRKAEAEGRSVGQRVAGTAMALGEGTPVGSFIDEAGAGLGALADISGLTGLAGYNIDPSESLGKAYSRRLGTIRGEQEAFRQQNPATSIALNVAGGAPAGSIIANRFMQGARQMGALPSIVRSGAEGLGLGALYGFGAGEDGLGARVSSMALGGGLGGVTGAAIPGLYGVGQQAFKLGRRAFTAPEINESVGRRAIQAMQAGGDTPQDVAGRLAQEAPQATIADISEGAATQAEILATKTPELRGVANRFFNVRQDDEPRRVAQNISELVSGDDFRKTSKELIRQRQESSRGAYGQAYDTVLDSATDQYKGLESIFNRPAIKRIVKDYKDAVSDVKGEGVPVNIDVQRSGDVVIGDVTTETADYVKKALDREYRRLSRGANVDRDAAGAILEVKQELVGLVDELNPAYRAAREQFAGDIAMQNALEAGEDIFTGKFREFEDIIEGLTDSERKMYLVGAANALKERAQKASASEARALLSGDKEQRILKLFRDEKAGRQFIKNLRSELGFRSTKQRVVGGSPTAVRQRLAREERGGSLLRDIEQTQGVAPAISKRAANVFEEAFPPSQREDRALLDLLLSPQQQGMTNLDALARLASSIESGNIARRRLGAAAATQTPALLNYLNQ